MVYARIPEQNIPMYKKKNPFFSCKKRNFLNVRSTEKRVFNTITFLASANTYRAANPNVLDVASRGHCNFTGTIFLHYLSKNDSSIEIIKQYFFCQIVAMNQKVIDDY